MPERPPFECIALLLQGGGALGSYQARSRDVPLPQLSTATRALKAVPAGNEAQSGLRSWLLA
jgi:hypothetical protein